MSVPDRSTRNMGRAFPGFRGSFHMGLSNRIAITALALFCTVITAALTLSTTFVCYAVSIDGEELGSTQSLSQARSAVYEAECKASALLGENVSFSDNLIVTTNLGAASTTADNITLSLLGRVDGLVQAYAITVDSIPVGIAGTKAELDDILNSVLAAYTNENTLTASFVEDVKVEYTFVSRDIEQDPESILALLDPANSDSPYSLTVSTVERKAVRFDIGFDTEFIDDATLYSDEISVECEGTNGIGSNRYIFHKENGIVKKRTPLGTSVITEPAARVVRVGTIPGSRTDSTGDYIWPTTGVISSYFGYRNAGVGSTYHKGIDIANDRGTEIWASDGGTVIHADWATGYGWFVKIEHDNGDVTCYGHLKEYVVAVGDKVCQGQLIGYMGNTGISSGPHLHFEVRLGGEKKVNPTKYLVGELSAGE